MKKNTLLYVIITILLIVIAVGITYIIMNNKNNEEITEPSNNDNNQEENNDEQITLSESELQEYLSYVPIEDGYVHDVYQNKYTNIQNIDKAILRNMALIKASDCLYKEYTCPYNHEKEIEIEVNYDTYSETVVTNNYIPLEYINKLLHQMYNYEISALKEKTILNAGGMGYIYSNEYFIMIGGGWAATEHISVLDDYNANEEELVIYEYGAYYDSFENKLYDYYTEKETDLGNLSENTSYDDKMTMLHNYLKEHKTEFTLYKHTFKKNDTGYYWYSTEIASEG